MPDVLIEYYEKIGEIEDSCGMIGIDIHAPTDLSLYKDREKEFLFFSSETEIVDIYTISLNDLHLSNPVVYCCGDWTHKIKKLTNNNCIPGTHPEMLDDKYDFRTLMNFFWTIAYFALRDWGEGGIKWEFEDEDIYGLSLEEKKLIEQRKKKAKKKYEQERVLHELIKENKYDEIPHSPLLKSLKLEELSNLDFLEKIANLESLYISDSKVPDIMGISTLGKLKKLTIQDSGKIDLTPLSKLTGLTQLVIIECDLDHPEIIGKLINLEKLHLSLCENFRLYYTGICSSDDKWYDRRPVNTGISNISFIRNLVKLNQLDISNLGVSDISPLEDLKSLKNLECENNAVSDISSLKNSLNLSFLRLKNNKISDISIFLSLANVYNIDLSNNDITDISPLSSCNDMYYLNLNDNPVKNIEAIANMRDIKLLELNRTNIVDLSPLKNCTKLSRLNIKSAKVSDISVLTNLNKLDHLDISYTEVKDFSPLQNSESSSLEYLDLRGLKMNSLEGIESLNIYFPWIEEDGYASYWKSQGDFIKNKEVIGLWDELLANFERIDYFPDDLLRVIISKKKESLPVENMDKKTPKRPTSVPKEAVYDLKDSVWNIDHRNAYDVYVGEFSQWYEDGTLKETAFYQGEEGDTVDFKAYNSDGTLWQEGRWEKGLCKSLTIYNNFSKMFNPEPPKNTAKIVAKKFELGFLIFKWDCFDKSGTLIKTEQDNSHLSDISDDIASAFLALSLRKNFKIAQRRINNINPPDKEDINKIFYDLTAIASQYYVNKQTLTLKEAERIAQIYTDLRKVYMPFIFDEVVSEILLDYLEKNVL